MRVGPLMHSLWPDRHGKLRRGKTPERNSAV